MNCLKVIGLSRITRTVVFCGLLLSLFLCFSGQTHAESDSYERLTIRIRKLENNKFVAVKKIGASPHGRAIYAVALTNPGKPESISSNRIRIVILSGQHGDEPLPAYAALDILESFVRGGKGISRQALRNVVVVFIPVVNPDGFVAKTRLNGAGIDLNRDWLKCSQPETSAVMGFIEKFRPHVLIDQHEWTKDDPYRPNCIETADFGRNANQQLARLLTTTCINRSSTNGLTLHPAYYIRQSDPRMAHRRFTDSGICAMLVETSPDSPTKRRLMAYEGVVKTVITTLSSPPDPRISKNASILMSKNGDAREWIAGLDDKWKSQPDSPAQPAYIFALLTAAIIAVIRAMTPRNSSKRSDDHADQLTSLNRYALTEIVRCDLPLRTRLDMIQRHKQRPSDRNRRSVASD